MFHPELQVTQFIAQSPDIALNCCGSGILVRGFVSIWDWQGSGIAADIDVFKL